MSKIHIIHTEKEYKLMCEKCDELWESLISPPFRKLPKEHPDMIEFANMTMSCVKWNQAKHQPL